MRAAIATDVVERAIERIRIALSVSPVSGDRFEPAWDEAHTAIKDARREWLRDAERTPQQWLAECLADVPGLSERHASVCKVITVRQFKQCFGSRGELLAMPQVSEKTVDEIQSALAAIGVAWPNR